MGTTTKIDWCDATWNPVIGCLHGCKYCYARRIAERFGGNDGVGKEGESWRKVGNVYEVEERLTNREAPAAFPFGFEPTFLRYQLDFPQTWKRKSRTIFVCSMADLFGDWVPDEWIKQVFEACAKAPQHRYLFLTKNPKRYNSLWKIRPAYVDGAMFGYSVTGAMPESWWEDNDPPTTLDSFMSIEPILRPFETRDIRMAQLNGWVIIGAETGNRKGRVVPEKKWVMDIADACKEAKTPLFMKESLRDLMGADFRQEFPWEVKT